MFLIHIFSEANGKKPATVIEGEALSVREREPNELVHFHEDDETTCAVCGYKGFMIWLSSKERHETHPNRCR